MRENFSIFTGFPVLGECLLNRIFLMAGCSRLTDSSKLLFVFETCPPPEEIMPDDKSKPGGQDRTRINVNEDYELRDWSKKFGVSPDELKKAVAKVGNNAMTLRNI